MEKVTLGKYMVWLVVVVGGGGRREEEEREGKDMGGDRIKGMVAHPWQERVLLMIVCLSMSDWVTGGRPLLACFLTDSRLLSVFVLLVAVGAAEGASSVRASLAGLVLVVVVTAYLQPLLCWVSSSSSHGLPWPSTKWPDLHPHWWVDLCSDLHLHPASKVDWLPLWSDRQLGRTLKKNTFFFGGQLRP